MRAIENDCRQLSSIKQKLKKEQRQLFFRRLTSNKLMVTGGVTIIFLSLVALIGPLLVPYNPYEMVVQEPITSTKCQAFIRDG